MQWGEHHEPNGLIELLQACKEGQLQGPVTKWRNVEMHESGLVDVAGEKLSMTPAFKMAASPDAVLRCSDGEGGTNCYAVEVKCPSPFIPRVSTCMVKRTHTPSH